MPSQKQAPERLPSPVPVNDWDLALSLESLNSERTQQDGADEREHSAHHQNIEPQGKVHVIPPEIVD